MLKCSNAWRSMSMSTLSFISRFWLYDHGP
jgi:hypothetical protein